MRDLLVDFGDGKIKPLLDLTDIEFEVLLKPVAMNCLIVDNVEQYRQNPIARIEIEKIIRRKNVTTS